ncbi:MAG: DMT family transporter [Acidimicrobiia bacterium]|nr:DMT family transporter [Acidimicrobiia bacterium]
MAARILSTADGTNRGSFTAVDWALFASIASIWGSSFLLIDIGLDAFEPGLVTFVRVGLGAVVLALVPRARRPVARADWPRVVALSVTWVALPFTLFPLAQQHINSAVTGMLNGATPVFTAFVATFMLRRLPRGSQLVGLAVGFAGVAAISLASGSEGRTQLLGVVLVLGATAMYGLSINISAPITQRYGSLPVMARMLALATLWTAPFGIVDGAASSFAWDAAVAVGFAGAVGTGAAFVIMGTLVGRVGSTRGSFITYFIPVVALVLGVVFRGDEVTPVGILGIVLVLIGAALASRREAAR